MTLNRDTFTYVADLVRRRSAIQLTPGKEYLVESRLMPLARECGAADVDAYVTGVRARPTEVDLVRIVEALTTNETSWFRDSAPFVALRQHILPPLIAARGTAARLRIWSGACSTGQEPYSIAMTLTDALPPSMSFEILATDLSTEVLERARSGTYSQLEVNRGLPAPMLVRHMVRSGTDWQISDELRRAITFKQHNLLDPAPLGGPFDVIFLRNVLIYFDLPTKRAILGRLRQVLKPDGVLVLGAAETTIGVDDEWARVPVGTGSVYRPGDATPPVPQPRTAVNTLPAASAAPASYLSRTTPSTPVTSVGARR
ncbi:CheR family methyltransferase [Cellulomonas soli]